MADDSNIDEILRSIDALLKEGEAEDHGHGGKGGQQPEAANADEHPAAEAANATDPDGEAEVAAEQPAVEEETGETQSSEADKAPPNFLLEAADETADAGETDEAGDAELAGTGDEDEVADQVGEGDESGEPQPRRIVLSEAMLVEDNLDLPLNYTETGSAEEQPEAEAPGQEEVLQTQAEEFQPEAEFQQLEEARPEEEDSQPGIADREELIERICDDIYNRLQQQLPEMLHGLVAEAVRRHLGDGTGEPDGQ